MRSEPADVVAVGKAMKAAVGARTLQTLSWCV
jgi:hypothetical protein